MTGLGKSGTCRILAFSRSAVMWSAMSRVVGRVIGRPPVRSHDTEAGGAARHHLLTRNVVHARHAGTLPETPLETRECLGVALGMDLHAPVGQVPDPPAEPFG